MGILSSKATTNLIQINDVPNKVIEYFEKYIIVDYNQTNIVYIRKGILPDYFNYNFLIKVTYYYIALKSNIYMIIRLTEDLYLSITVSKNDDDIKNLDDIMTFDGLKSYLLGNSFGYDCVMYQYIYDMNWCLIDEKIVEKIINDIGDVLTEQYSYETETEYVLK